MMRENFSVKDFIDATPKLIPVLAVILYAIGFIVVNSYLSRFGIGDYGVANGRFIFAGSTYAIYIAFWWIGLGRFAIYDERFEYLNKATDIFEKTSIIVGLIVSLVTRAIYTSLAAEFVLFEIGDKFFPILFYYSMAYLIQSQINETCLKYFKSYVIRSSVRVLCLIFLIYVFTFGTNISGSLFEISISYLILTGTVSFLVQVVSAGEFFDLRRWHAAPYQAVIILGSIIGFGYSTYGHINLQRGGAKSTHVIVYLKDEGGDKSGFLSSSRNQADLLYQTEKFSLLNFEGIVTLVYNDQIRFIRFSQKHKKPASKQFDLTSLWMVCPIVNVDKFCDRSMVFRVFDMSSCFENEFPSLLPIFQYIGTAKEERDEIISVHEPCAFRRL